MSKNQQNDPGYKQVMQEYDFYNDNNNDFEIIDEIPTSYISNTSKEIDKNNDKTKNSINEKQKEKLQKFIVDIFKIIFNSRNKLSEFASRSKKKLNEDINDDMSFSFDIEELIAYDNLKAYDDKDKNKRQKYTIDFFLYENNNEDIRSLKSASITGCPKLLVERWKIKYKDNFEFDQKNINLDTKMKIIEKDIILYSHILPLYNISKNEKYYTEFKFNPTPKEKKNFILENMTKKIKIQNEELFGFKLSITYLKVKSDNISYLLKSNNNDFIIITNKKSRKRFLSDTYNKKSSNQLFKKESKDENKENNDNNVIKNDFIIENYFSNESSNDNQKNEIRKRRLSVKEKRVKSKFFNNNEDSISDISEDNLSLVINESNEDNSKKIISNLNIDNIKEGKDIKNKKKKINKNGFIKKSSTFRGNSKNELKIEQDKIKNIEFKNKKITKIIKEYKIMKKMMMVMPNFGNISCDKLNIFISNN